MRIHNDEELRALLLSCGWTSPRNNRTYTCPWDNSLTFGGYAANMTRVLTKTFLGVKASNSWRGDKYNHLGCIPNMKDLEWIWDVNTGLLTCEGLIAIRLT